MTEETQATEEAVAQDHFAPGDGIETPEIRVPIPDPQAHRGQITTMGLETFPSGTTSMFFNLLSAENGREDKFQVWLPRDWVEDITIGGTNDPRNLPEEDKNRQFSSYVRNIYNSSGTAVFQVLRQIAAKAGRALPDDTERPATLDEFYAQMEAIIPGIDVVYTLAAEKNAEPQYAHILKVRGVFDPEDVIGNPKKLKKFDKLWEQVPQ